MFAGTSRAPTYLRHPDGRRGLDFPHVYCLKAWVPASGSAKLQFLGDDEMSDDMDNEGGPLADITPDLLREFTMAKCH